MKNSRLAVCVAASGLAASVANAQTCGNPWSTGPTGPPPRWCPSVAYDSDRQKAVVFGGIVTSSTFLSDTWEWSAAGTGGGGAWTQRNVPGPTARYGAGLAYDSARHVCVLFGGGVTGGYSNQTWEWNGVAWTQVQPAASPPASEGSLLAYDAARARVVLVTTQASTGQTWEYDGSTWALQAAATPFTSAEKYSMAYDASRSQMVLFGNYFGNYYGGIEVWERGASAWTIIEQSTFPYSSYAPPRASYDPVGQRILVIDGHAIGTASWLWSWGGPQARWTRLSSPGPAPLALGGAAFDAAGGQFVTVGGYSPYSGPASDRVDLYRPALHTGPDLSNVGVRSLLLALGGPTATLPVLGNGTGSVTYRWRLNGVPLDEGGGFSGVTTPQLTIDPNDGAHSGYYDAVVTDDCGTSIRPETYVVINCYANCDGSSGMPILNAEDFQCFLNSYASATSLTVAEQIASYGNCDHSTSPPVLNANDFQCFLNSFAVGCP